MPVCSARCELCGLTTTEAAVRAEEQVCLLFTQTDLFAISQPFN